MICYLAMILVGRQDFKVTFLGHRMIVKTRFNLPLQLQLLGNLILNDNLMFNVAAVQIPTPADGNVTMLALHDRNQSNLKSMKTLHNVNGCQQTPHWHIHRKARLTCTHVEALHLLADMWELITHKILQSALSIELAKKQNLQRDCTSYFDMDFGMQM